MNFPLMINCIFHDEKIPSLRIWLNGGFYCHGCGFKGNVVGFNQLNNIYQLNLNKYKENNGQLILEINTILKNRVYETLEREPIELGYTHSLDYLIPLISESDLINLILEAPDDNIQRSLIGLSGRCNSISILTKIKILKEGLKSNNIHIRDITIGCVESWENDKQLFDLLKDHLLIEKSEFLIKYIRQICKDQKLN